MITQGSLLFGASRRQRPLRKWIVLKHAGLEVATGASKDRIVYDGKH